MLQHCGCLLRFSRSTLDRLAVLASLDEVKQTLAAMSISRIPCDMSKASLTQQNFALRNKRLRMRVVRASELAGFVEIATPAFARWGTLSEDAATPLLRAHFEEHFRLPPNTHVEDVHCAEALFSADVPSTDAQGRSVVTHFRGKTDLIVVDSLHVHRGDPESAVTGAICLVELKMEKALRDKRASCRAQAILELLAIEDFSGYAVPVVLTNLEEHNERHESSGIHIFSRKGGIVREFVGAQGGPLTLSEANGILALLLPAVLDERVRTDAVLLERIVEGGDDEEGDDEGPGGAEDSGAEADGAEVEGAVAASAATAHRYSNRIAALGRSGAGSASSGFTACGAPDFSSKDARLFAAVSIEERARRLRALASDSPQILQVLRHLTANVDE
jgi:hypothetical protein